MLSSLKDKIKDVIVSLAVRGPEDSTPVFSEHFEREEFERESHAKTGGRLSRQRDGSYFDEYVETMWQGWLLCAKHNHQKELIRLDDQRISDSAI